MMKTVKEALKYWKQLKEQEKSFPNAHIYTNIKNQKVDMEELAKTNPYLFDMFTRIFSGVEKPETVQTWKNYKQAYEELESQGLLQFKNIRNKIMKEKMDSFFAKVDSNCLVPLNELEDVITEKKHKGQIDIQVDFNEYIHLIEKYYDFDYRDFFQKFKQEKLDYKSILGLSKEEFDKHYAMSPIQSFVATKIAILSDKYDEVNGMPYVDFWHHLLDHDFAEVVNGAVMYLFSDYEVEEFNVEEIQVPGILFQKFRKVLFKEIAQLPFYKGKEPEEIEFHICW